MSNEGKELGETTSEEEIVQNKDDKNICQNETRSLNGLKTSDDCHNGTNNSIHELLRNRSCIELSDILSSEDEVKTSSKCLADSADNKPSTNANNQKGTIDEENKNDFSNFFEKYDQILLNSPVLSDADEDTDETKQKNADDTGQGHSGESESQGHDGKGQGQDGKKKKKGWNILKHIKEDKIYRKKLIHSVFLCWAFVILGWIIGQFGPSFLDLQVITHTRLEEGSAFMTSHSVGYLIGSLISGILFDKFNKIMLLFFAILGNGLTVIVIPWCVIYEVMIAIHLVKGLFSGGLDALCNADMVYVWGEENGSYMQALHFAFAVGGIVSPLATAPFLIPRRHQERTSASTSHCIPVSVVHDFNNTYSYVGNSIVTNTSVVNSTFISNTTLIPEQTTELFKIESRVYIAYSISALLAFSAAAPFLIIYIMSKKKKKSKTKQEDKHQHERKLPLKMKVLIMVNMMCMMGIYSAIEDTYAGFLATFMVQQLNWTKTLGSFATSFYWAAFGAGRFFGIFLVKFCYPVRMISIYCLLLILAFLGLLFSSTSCFDEGVWVCVPLNGLALSIIFPTVFTWTEEELLPVTGKIASLFLIASSSGTMINPIVLGFLMDELTPMYFCYLLLGESIILYLLYVSALFISRNIQRGNTANVKSRHLGTELPVKSNSEPDLYRSNEEHDGLLFKSGSCIINGNVIT